MKEQDRPTLWRASADLGAALAALEKQETREDDAQLMVVAGTNALAAIDRLARDRRLWRTVGQDLDGLRAADLAPLYRLLDGGWPTLMDAIGYIPPPPAEQMATDLLGALVRLRAVPPEPGALRQAADEARAELLEVADVLRGVLAEAPEIPRAVRARSLRGPLGEAQRAMVAAAPLAIFAGAAGALPGGVLVTGLGAAALTVAGPGLDAARGSRRRRSADGWRARVDAAMVDLSGVLSGDPMSSQDVDRAMRRCWVAEGALHAVAATDPGDPAAEEGQELLHAIRQTLAKDRAVPEELRQAVRAWRTLSPGRMAVYRMERDTELRHARIRKAASRRPVPRAEAKADRDRPAGELPDGEADGPEEPRGRPAAGLPSGEVDDSAESESGAARGRPGGEADGLEEPTERGR